MNQELILSQLKKIQYKESSQDIVSMGLVSAIIIRDDNVAFSLKVIDNDLNYFENLVGICKELILQANERANISVVLTKESSLKSFNRKSLPGVKKIIAISSCKGGVGKSTTCVNLAAIMAKLGHKIGLADLDIYGPSIPSLLGIRELPMIIDDMMQPIKQHGIKTNSFGFLVDKEKAAIWRGPMITKALNQILAQTNWGELDLLILDLPPGTGDIHLSLMSNYQIDGAILISTPSEVAIADLVKTIDMYKKLDISILGIIQNMSYFLDDNKKKHFIFGSDGAKKIASEYNLKLITDIPILPSLGNDIAPGIPAALNNDEVASYFIEIATNIYPS